MIKIDEKNYITSYKAGTLRGNKVIELFSELIKNGEAWSFENSYKKMALSLIERGYLTDNGKILKLID
jgi:hypothetical protein